MSLPFRAVQRGLSILATRRIASNGTHRAVAHSIAARPAMPAAPVYVQWRHYAKKTNKKKAAASAPDTEADAGDKPRAFDEKKLEERMGNAISHLKEQLSVMRIGRANPALLDSVRVQIENATFSLRDLAQVGIRDPQTLMVTVHDQDYRSAVEKAIRESGLNLNPVIDNEIIRVPVPKPTKESRDRLAKMAGQTGEQLKAKIRSLRQDGMKHLKQDAKFVPADEIKRAEKHVQTMTDKHNKMIDDLVKSKIKEIQS